MASDRKLTGYAALVAIFVLGAATGGAASYAMMQRHYARMFRDHPGEMMDGRRLGALSRRLDLDSTQRDRIRAIMERHGDERRRLTREMFERCGDSLRAAQGAIDDEVRQTLRPEQVPRYDAVVKERHERFGFGPR